MEINSPEAEPRRRKTVVQRIFAFAAVTLVVAALGAFIGWIAGEMFIGALFGLVIGLFAASRSGHVMSEPNVNKPG